MIIAFYPGAGGNRYLRSIQGFEWDRSNVSYDLLQNQHFENRYLLKESIIDNQEFILTHCLNATHLQKKLPGHKITYIIGDLRSCLQREWQLAGHQRFVNQHNNQPKNRLEHYKAFKDATWPVCNTIDELNTLPNHIINEVNMDFENTTPRVVAGILKQLEVDTINKINSAYEIIKWHKDYYSMYPLEYSQDAVVIDIDKDHSDFCNVMRQQFGLYSSEIFDTVWSKLNA